MEDNGDILTAFADQLGVEPEVVEERWDGRPDRLMEDIFRIRDMDTGEVRGLELFDTQRKAVMAYFYGDADTINNYKGRRIGYSFIYALCFLVEGILVPNSFYPVVSRKYEQAENRIEDIENLIDNAKVDIPTNFVNKGEIELWNGSGYKAYSGDPDASRGDKSARAVLLDEMAFIEDQQKVKRAFGAFLSGEEPEDGAGLDAERQERPVYDYPQTGNREWVRRGRQPGGGHLHPTAVVLQRRRD
ncbi:hypothetical protein [Halospeciosus flavus]|uniref:hypothetical protein n=1 Tax=Halospeciosus flavus TaxID=3032283 RepID=UPI00361BABCB